MNSMDLQHPDITSAERTGYPTKPYAVKIELDSGVQRAYIKDTEDDFIDWCFADPDIIQRYLEETERSLFEWVREVLAV